MNYIYQNYHKHSERTNPIISDSTVTYKDYAEAAVKYGHSILSSAEHGYQGRYIETYDTAKDYKLKCLIGAEAYWVRNRLAPDNSNCHIWIGAKNENGRQAINDILSEANLTGFYFRPRVDVPLLLSLPKDDVWITTACLAYWKYEDIDSITETLSTHFGKNFFLEVQYHNTDRQKEINKHILTLHNKLKIPLIMGCDSHYISADQHQTREDFLLSKGIKYEDEEGWFLDYVDGQTAYNRFAAQNILTHTEITDAIANTNTFLDVEEYDSPVFNTDIKLPTLYDGEHEIDGVKLPKLDQQGRDEEYKKLVWQGWNKYKDKVPKEEWPKYEKEIEDEIQTVVDCHMADYFINDHYIVKKGKEKGGWLTKTGRGCFAPGALVHTIESLKPIENVVAGDTVFDMYGKPRKVLNTFKYPVEEDMIRIYHAYSAGEKFPMICTQDHKIRVFRNGEQQWVEAQFLQQGDYVVCPRIQMESNTDSLIDLNKYNVFGFDYDDEYIYEFNPYKNKTYRYNPSEISRNTKWGKSTIEKIANGVHRETARSAGVEKDILDYTGFSSIEEYVAYVKEQRTVRITRYIPNDFLMNEFVGMMYGDGFCSEQKIVVGLAYNTENHKNNYNKEVFCRIAARVGLQIEDRIEKAKNLGQIIVASNIFSEYVKQELFVSKKGKTKEFNPKLLSQSPENLYAIARGLDLTDGSDYEDTRFSFDNTSMSIVNAYKLIKMMYGDKVLSMSKRESWQDKRGYICKDSYKCRTYEDSDKSPKITDRTILADDYIYLPVQKTEKIGGYKGYVYDFEVEESHSYLLYNMVVHNSGVSFFTNNLLGFTEVDRIAAKVRMYSERFMTADRILASGSLPDIDMNVADQAPFAEAQAEILGEDHSYPMIAYGTYQKSAAWKLYAKAKGVPFETANAVSEQLKRYENAVKHADDEEKDDIDVLDYIDDQFKEIYEDSKDYMGLITSWSIAPCGYLLYQGSIRKEIGLVKIKDHLCCLMDGLWAEHNHFLKNDWLRVAVVELIYKSYHRAGLEPPPQQELLSMCPPNDSVWSMYKTGCTLGLNQVEQPGTSSRVAKYAPINISELCAFIAAIRPGFKSMYKTFESREPFSYGVDQIDDLIQTDEMPNSYIITQEQTMSVLHYAGIPMSECYTVIKSISKKRIEKILSYKDTFINGIVERLSSEGTEREAADTLAHNIWQIIEDSASYLFNSSHSYCVSLDSVYSAWIKAHHHLAFYETLLQIQEKKGNKDKMVEIKREAENYFGTSFPPYRFGQDNREIRANFETNEINNSIKAIKGLPKVTGDLLWTVAEQHPKSMTDTLFLCKQYKVSDAAIENLAKISFFSPFGNDVEIARIIELYHFFSEGTAKKIKKDKIENQDILKILSKYATDTNAKGEELSQWSITSPGIQSAEAKIKAIKALLKLYKDTEPPADLTDKLESAMQEEEQIRLTYEQQMLNEMEQYILSIGYDDLDFRGKMANQMDILGYVDLTTGREEDRRKLLIEDIQPMKDKKTGKPWCYRVDTRSIGSGKSARLSIPVNTYDETPIRKGDTIFTPQGSLKKNAKGYWYLYWYDMVYC